MSPEQKQQLQEVFEANPSLEAVYQTTDGQCFAQHNSAINHEMLVQGVGRLNEDQQPVFVRKTDVVGNITPPAPPKTGGEPNELTPAQLAQQQAKALVAKIEAATTVEEVDALIAGITWKSVLKAAEANKAELIAAAELAAANEGTS